ncbi:MAG: HAD family hydrolase [Planctomycetota bacterium]
MNPVRKSISNIVNDKRKYRSLSANLSNGVNKAVFLDRDNTLIKLLKPRLINTTLGRVLNDCVIRPSEIKFCPGVIGSLKLLQAKGYKLIIITNQSVVARGVITEVELKRIHRRLIDLLRNQGVKIAGVYYCPHHPEGLIKKYRRKCCCRKPEPGMIKRSAREHRIDLKQSFFVGDSENDFRAGQKAGVKPIIIKPGEGFSRAIREILQYD